MAGQSQDRISVVQRDRVVPLMPGPSAAHGVQPWAGVLLERHAVEAIEIPEHEHRDLVLHLQISGSPELEWWSEGHNRVETTGPGSLILLDAGTRDRLRWSSPSQRLVVSVKPELLKQAADELGASPDIRFRNQWALRDPALANLVTEMAREADAEFPLGRLYAELLGMGLASTLLRRHGGVSLPALQTAGGLPAPTLLRVLEFITANLHRDLPLKEIAAEAGFSEFHFARAFRASTGQSVHQYLLEQRIAEAKRLLRGSGLAIYDIALMTGFASASNFARVFRRRTKVTPASWRAAR